jgi:hypothetical protein
MPDPRGPFGAKEVGQGPLLPVMPAVANAVYDAIGVRIDEVPITPEKVLKALDAKAAGKTPRYGPRALPRHRVARTARRPAALGGRGRKGKSQKSEVLKAEVSSCRAVIAHDATPALHVPLAADSAAGGGASRGGGRWRDAGGRRDRSPPEHEAKAAGTFHAHRPSPRRRAAANRQRLGSDHWLRHDVERDSCATRAFAVTKPDTRPVRTPRSGRQRCRSRRRTCETWARSAATSASTPAATTTTRTTSGGRRSTSA